MLLTHCLRRAGAALALLAVLASAAIAGERPRLVVELFTSQGCSSCPPADELLARLAEEPDIVALTYPVQIWDHLGWRDTLATPANTTRQQAYAEHRGDRQIYTPQAVVNGLSHAVGSSRPDIEARAAGSVGRALLVPVALRREGAGVVGTVARWPGGAAPPARLLLVSYAPSQTVDIGRGENGGRRVTYRNVVRGIADHGAWSGEPVQVSAPLAAGLGATLLVQAVGARNRPGPILGAARLD